MGGQRISTTKKERIRLDLKKKNFDFNQRLLYKIIRHLKVEIVLKFYYFVQREKK